MLSAMTPRSKTPDSTGANAMACRRLVCGPLEQDGFANAFSTRLGGVSPMPENSLNLAGFNEDAAENIYENRRRFLKLFTGEWTLTGCWQVHGADVRVVRTEAEAQPTPGVLGEAQYCDVLVSNVPHVLLGVKTADCVPVLIGDPVSGAFAAVHAGWRGTVASVVRRAIEQMQEQYGAKARKPARRDWSGGESVLLRSRCGSDRAVHRSISAIPEAVRAHARRSRAYRSANSQPRATSFCRCRARQDSRRTAMHDGAN